METKQINVFSSELASDLFNQVIDITIAKTPADINKMSENVNKVADLLFELLEEESISGDIYDDIREVREDFMSDVSDILLYDIINEEITPQEAYCYAMTEFWRQAKDIRLTVIDFQLQDIDAKIKQNKSSVSALKRKRDVLKKYA